MTKTRAELLKNYGSIIYLLLGIIGGSVAGLLFPDVVKNFKPIGDIFLNLLFVSVIPLVFFAISSAIAKVEGDHTLGKIISRMSITFVVGVIVAALFAILTLWLFPVDAPKQVAQLHEQLNNDPNETWGDKMVRFFYS